MTEAEALAITTESPEQTRSLGRLLGGLAGSGDIYLLSGKLGAGKTHLVQGMAFGLGIQEYACSPSFMIARQYQGRLPLYHLDLYRLERPEEISDLGLEQYFDGQSVCAIEWADRGSDILPADNLTVKMEDLGDDRRRITFLPRSPRYSKLVKELKQALEKDLEVKWSFQ